MFEIVYNEAVIKEDILKLSPDWREKIKSAIEKKLVERPEVFGKPLRRSLKNYRKLRVHDYRVIFRIESKVVKIVAIMHRSYAYTEVLKRI